MRGIFFQFLGPGFCFFFSLIWFLFFLRYLLEFKGKGEKSGIGVQDFPDSYFMFLLRYAFCSFFVVKKSGLVVGTEDVVLSK